MIHDKEQYEKEKEREEVIDQKVVHIRVVTMISAIIWIITTLICFWKIYIWINERITNIESSIKEINNQTEKRIIMLEIKQQSKADREDIRVMESKLTNIERMLSEIKEQSTKKWGQ